VLRLVDETEAILHSPDPDLPRVGCASDGRVWLCYAKRTSLRKFDVFVYAFQLLFQQRLFQGSRLVQRYGSLPGFGDREFFWRNVDGACSWPLQRVRRLPAERRFLLRYFICYNELCRRRKPDQSNWPRILLCWQQPAYLFSNLLSSLSGGLRRI